MAPQNQNQSTLQTKLQTVSEHIQELRRRLTWSALVFFLAGGVGYLLHRPLIALLRRPLNETLYYSSPAGGFNFVMKICLLVGVAAAVPVLVHHILSFVQPALKSPLLKKQVRRLSLLSGVLAVGGMIFAYVMVLPMSLHFFAGFRADGFKALISADDYLNFVINCLLTFIFIFQIPIIMLFIDRIKPLPPGKLLHYEKHVIVGALALAVILPFTYDPITQFVIAIPIIALYNFCIVLLWLVHRKAGHKLPKAPNNFELNLAPLAPTPRPTAPAMLAQSVAAKPIPRLISDVVLPQSNLGLSTNHYQNPVSYKMGDEFYTV